MSKLNEIFSKWIDSCLEGSIKLQPEAAVPAKVQAPEKMPEVPDLTTWRAPRDMEYARDLFQKSYKTEQGMKDHFNKMMAGNGRIR